MGNTAPLITDEELAVDLAALAVETMGWVPLDEGAYLHVGEPDALVINVVGVPDAGMAGMNVLWVG
jgi:hypothetical protein